MELNKTDLNKKIAELIKVMNYKRSNPAITVEQLQLLLKHLDQAVNQLP